MVAGSGGDGEKAGDIGGDGDPSLHASRTHDVAHAYISGSFFEIHIKNAGTLRNPPPPPSWLFSCFGPIVVN